jgi:predicted GNAT family N-acyltransferase
VLDTEPSDTDPTTLHFLGLDTESNQYVAVARAVVIPESQSFQLGRIAVLPESRGRRYGLTIMQFAVQYICSWDALPAIRTMFLLCPLDKCAFYEKSGFVATQRSEVVRGLVLYEMTQSW